MAWDPQGSSNRWTANVVCWWKSPKKWRICNHSVIFIYENGGTPKSSILIGFSIINHPFWGIPIFWKHPHDLSTWIWSWSSGDLHLMSHLLLALLVECIDSSRHCVKQICKCIFVSIGYIHEVPCTLISFWYLTYIMCVICVICMILWYAYIYKKVTMKRQAHSHLPPTLTCRFVFSGTRIMGLRHLHHGALGDAESLPALPDPVRISGGSNRGAGWCSWAEFF